MQYALNAPLQYCLHTIKLTLFPGQMHLLPPAHFPSHRYFSRETPTCPYWFLWPWSDLKAALGDAQHSKVRMMWWEQHCTPLPFWCLLHRNNAFLQVLGIFQSIPIALPRASAHHS